MTNNLDLCHEINILYLACCMVLKDFFRFYSRTNNNSNETKIKSYAVATKTSSWISQPLAMDCLLKNYFN